MTKRITIAAEPREKITVDLIGVEYVLRPFKSAIAMNIAKQAQDAGEDQAKMLEMIDDTINLIFGPRQAKAIHKRLNDAEDDLDISHIFDLVKQLTEASTETPSM